MILDRRPECGAAGCALLRRTRQVVAMLAVAAVAIGASARQLAPVDRLADAPMTATASRGVAPQSSLHMHGRLDVPTFVWADRGGPAAALARSAGIARTDAPEAAARGYLHALGSLYGSGPGTAAAASLRHMQTLPNGAVIVKLRNRIDGIDVFREEAAVLLGPSRELIAIGGFLGGGEQKPRFRSSAASAGVRALADWNFTRDLEGSLAVRDGGGGYLQLELPPGMASADGSMLQAPLRAKPVLFRLPGELRPAWYVEAVVRDGRTPAEVDGYAYVIDDADGGILFRHSLSADAAFSYRVFAEADGTALPLPGPAGRGAYPHPTGTPDGYQPPFVPPSLITLQNYPFSRNDPWLLPGAAQTTGNNVEAFADVAPPDGFTVPGDILAGTTSAGSFDYVHDPSQQPNASNDQIGAAVVNLFYMNNLMHDWFYDAGFDEAAGNAQVSNYGRGGLENDSIVAEGQDFAGRDNANMLTPPDGGRPRMRMYLFNAVHAVGTTVTPGTTIASAGADFGPQTFDVTASLALANPADGCTPIGPEVAGRIALLDRGNCSYQTKVLAAQTAGAAGAIVADNVAEPLPASMPVDSSTAPTIPATLIALDAGAALKAAMAQQTITARLIGAKGVNRDGTLDNTIIAHEWAHYLSNRLIGDGVGLYGQQAQGMGEGWSDFVSMLLLVKGSDAQLPANAAFTGTYAVAGYAFGGPPAPPTNGAYYGVRRYPYSRTLAKNPLTFAHIVNGVALPDSPAPRFGANGIANAEVHNTGEVWASMLWDCYSNLLNDSGRLAFADAQSRMKRYLVAGMKLTPVTPTFVEARDALLAAILAEDAQDYALCLGGFAKRGLGLGAVAPDRFSTTNAGVVESYLTGGAIAVTATSLADVGSCDADGVLDGGETGSITITLHNVGTTALPAMSGSLSATNPDVTFPAGSRFGIPALAVGQSTTSSVPIRLVSAAGVESSGITVTVDDAALTVERPVTSTAWFWLNADQRANVSATDDVEATTTAWTAGASDPATPSFLLWHRIAQTGIDHRWSGPDADAAVVVWLQSPPLDVDASGNFTFTFRHRFAFEVDQFGTYDGGQVQLSEDGGATWTDVGTSATPGYNGIISNYAGTLNPLVGQAAYVGRNGAYPDFDTVIVDLGAAYAGKTVLVRFLIANDGSVGAPGWEVDDIKFSNIANTPFAALVPNACYEIVAQSGAQQWTTPGAPFPLPLKALVRTAGGTPRSGVLVTFSTPTGGASARFGGSATVMTDASGIATSPPMTATAGIGSYIVKAGDGMKTAMFPLTNATTQPSLDADGNQRYDALTDGLLLLRYFAGANGNALSAGALGAGAGRAAGAIRQYLTNIRSMLDIDGNGQYDVATDGLLVVRYLLGVRGAALVADAIGAGATRREGPQVESYLQSLMP